jgi:cytochrome c oxidase subunit 2
MRPPKSDLWADFIALSAALFLATLGLTLVSSHPIHAANIKEIDVIASQFKFEPAVISVAEGDRVRLRLRSTDRTHGIGIKAFRVKARVPKGGDAVIVEFVADRAGTFDISCSAYCGTGHRSMTGTLIVLASKR